MTSNLKSIQHNRRGKWDELAKQVTDVSLVQKLAILKRMYHFPQRTNEARW